jgi:hypothetical protein
MSDLPFLFACTPEGTTVWLSIPRPCPLCHRLTHMLEQRTGPFICSGCRSKEGQ